MGLNMTLLRRLFLLILFALAVPFGTAQAHNLNVFAISTGDTIEGYVYFTGGTRAQQAQIELRDAEKNVLLTTTTDHEGSFALQVSHRGDYTVLTNTGDGHVATFNLYADEFAQHLPVASEKVTVMVRNVGTSAPAESTDKRSNSVPEPEPEKSSHSTTSGLNALSSDELGILINQAVARQIGPLRAEVNAYRNDVRLSDILGGIGVIIGIFGVSAWGMARYQTRK